MQKWEKTNCLASDTISSVVGIGFADVYNDATNDADKRNKCFTQTELQFYNISQY